MEITWLLGVPSENSDCAVWLPLPPSGRHKSLVRGADCDLGSVSAFRRISQVCRVQMASLAAKLSFLNGVVNSQKSLNRRSSVAQDKIKAFPYSFQCARYICLAFLGFQDAAMAIAMKLSLLQRASSLYGSGSGSQDISAQASGETARFGLAPSQSFTPTIKIFSEQHHCIFTTLH